MPPAGSRIPAEKKGKTKMDELLEILENLHPDVNFEEEEHLIDHGILDSFDIVTLISQISETYDVTITAEKIIPENFNSAAAINNLIEELMEED